MNRSDAALVREMTRRVLRTYDQATADDAIEGASWYERANELSTALSAGTYLSTEQCAGIIAALSPRCSWSANARGAARMVAAVADDKLAAPIVAGTLANRRKAWRIAEGDDPAAVLSGPKVRAFWRNICGDSDAVTVDVWAARIAEGRRFKDRAPTGKRYRLIAEAYRRAADLRGISPREMQSTCWVAYRRIHGKAYDL